jgi:hypothetical protein
LVQFLSAEVLAMFLLMSSARPIGPPHSVE